MILQIDIFDMQQTRASAGHDYIIMIHGGHKARLYAIETLYFRIGLGLVSHRLRLM